MLRPSIILRFGIFGLLFTLTLSGGGCLSFRAKQSSTIPIASSSVTTSPATVSDQATSLPVVGSIQPWRGAFLGPRQSVLWLVTHTEPVPDDRPLIRGTFVETNSNRRGSVTSQAILSDGFTFGFNWGQEEQEQGYGTSTRAIRNSAPILKGEVRVGSSTQPFVLESATTLPGFALRRFATSTKPDAKSSCDFSVEYPELQPFAEVSEATRSSINTKIVQSIVSGTSTLPIEGTRFVEDCSREIAELKKDSESGFPEQAFYVQTLEPDIVFANDQVVSVLFLSYSYTGGAHGNYGYDAHTYDLRTGNELVLQDLVRSDQLKLFYQRVSKKLLGQNRDLLFPETVQDIERFVGEKGATSTQVQEQQFGHLTNWYLTNEGIVFFYNPYEIAPYAAGVQEIVLPFSEWKDLARPETLSRLTLPL